MKLLAYKMKYNHGNAPRVEPDCRLSLYGCNANLEKYCQIGGWIAGFTSQKLGKTPIGQENLIYLGKVTQKMPVNDRFKIFFDEFYYFGENTPLILPKRIRQGLQVPKTRNYCNNDLSNANVQNFIAFAKKYTAQCIEFKCANGSCGGSGGICNGVSKPQKPTKSGCNASVANVCGTKHANVHNVKSNNIGKKC